MSNDHSVAFRGGRADIPGFKPVIEPWRIEYGRIRKLGGGDYWAGHRLEEGKRQLRAVLQLAG